MSAPIDRRDVLTVEDDEFIEVTCEFGSADGIPDRPAELRNVVRLVGIEMMQDCESQGVVEVENGAVRLPDIQRRGA